MSRTVSMRWVIAVVAGVVVGMFALTGTAAAPPAGAPVRIIDADDSSLAAHVDADGNLQVGGTVQASPTEPLTVRSSFIDLDGSNTGLENVFTVPAGKQLVVEYVFVDGRVSVGQTLTSEFIAGNVFVHTTLFPQGEIDPGLETFSGEGAARLYVGPESEVSCQLRRSDADSPGSFIVGGHCGFSGYLVPA
jgi:hypothetical protein